MTRSHSEKHDEENYHPRLHLEHLCYEFFNVNVICIITKCQTMFQPDRKKKTIYSMYICMCVCVCVCVCVCMYIYIYIYIYTCVYTHTHTQMHIESQKYFCIL